MKFIYAFVLFSAVAHAQSVEVISSQDGLVLKNNGSVTINKKAWKNFSETKQMSLYQNEDKNGVKNEAYVLRNPDSSVQRVATHFDDPETGTMTESYAFEKGALASFTECSGTECTTVSKNLCEAVEDFYHGKVDTDVFSKAQAKHKECFDFYTNLMYNVLAPKAKEMVKAETANLAFTGRVLVHSSPTNFFNSLSVQLKDANKEVEKLKALDGDLYKAQRGMEGYVFQLIRNCRVFQDRSPAKKVAAASVVAPKSKTKVQ